MSVWTWCVLYIVFHTVMYSCLADVCPDQCWCSLSSDCDGTTVYCSGLGLTSVPTDFPNDSCSINLRDNGITSIEKETFAGLRSLETLNLYGNDITSIEKEAFAGLTNLKTLDLFRNGIISIEKEAFAGLASLQTLYLYRNAINSIEKEAFAGLVNLESLFLDSNDINDMEKDVFAGLASLQTLVLSWNKITSIEKGTFAALTSLRTLYLTHNHITSIEKEAFAGLANIETLFIGDNPFYCTCHLENFVEFLQGNITYDRLPDYKEPQCSTPSYMRGKNLRDVPFEEMECMNSDCEKHNKPLT